MTGEDPAAVVRPASCTANLDSDYPTCERCGSAWRRGDAPPACAPMSINRLRMALLAEAAALEGSHHAVVQMQEGGLKADPVDPLRRAMTLRGVLLFVDRCGNSTVIMDELKRIARNLARAAEAEARGGADD